MRIYRDGQLLEYESLPEDEQIVVSGPLDFNVTLSEWFLWRSPGEHKQRGKNIVLTFLAQTKSSQGSIWAYWHMQK